MNKYTKAEKIRTNSVGWMMKMISNRLGSLIEQELKRLGLDLKQFGVLMALLEEEGLTQTEIGKKITLPGYATTRTIDALEKKQLIERRTDERSRRSYRIYLTDKGHATGPELFIIINKVNEDLLSVISATERKQLTTILQKILSVWFA